MEFVDLKRQYSEYRVEILERLEQVMESAAFINGPAVGELEQKLANRVGVRHAIGCSSGTDALVLGLMAAGVRPGDEVLVPDFSFIATAEAISLVGAIPVFVDIQEDTFNINPELLTDAVTDKTVGIIPVSLYGQPPDMDAIGSFANCYNLWVMEDGAQSFGADYQDRRSCGLSILATTSFFPAKPLGAYGDAGAVFTTDDGLAEKIRMIRNHGQRHRYDHHVIGLNGRLDTLQATVLLVKLNHFDEEVRRRGRVAGLYTEMLRDEVSTPTIRSDRTSVWAQYTIRVKNRDSVRQVLKRKGIPTAIHYPQPLHRQPVYRDHRQREQSFPVAEEASSEVLSLPMHAFLDDEDVRLIATTLLEAVNG